MDSGPGHIIPQQAVLVLLDTMFQLGQVTMELNAAGSKFVAGLCRFNLN